MNRLRILLVEDHGDTLLALAKLLRLSGHEVHPASSAGEALQLASGGCCDLVVTDIGLPDRSGAELMHDLRRLYSLPGIAMTAYGEDHLVSECEDAGFSTRILKPVAFDKLLSAIQEVSSRMSAPKIKE